LLNSQTGLLGTSSSSLAAQLLLATNPRAAAVLRHQVTTEEEEEVVMVVVVVVTAEAKSVGRMLLVLRRETFRQWSRHSGRFPKLLFSQAQLLPLQTLTT
jgi:hypothetical protein